MPIYVYEVIRDEEPDGLPGCRFEVLQGIKEPALVEHPVTGQPVRRVVQLASLAGAETDLANRTKLDERNLSRHGLAKYVKIDEQTYEKMSGDGPKRLSSEELRGQS